MNRRRYDGRNGRPPYYGGRRDDDGIGCLVLLILAVLAMPLAGLYLILKKAGDDGTKAVGWILLIVGAIIWIYLLVKAGH